LTDLDRAAALKPGEPGVLAARARALATVRRYEAAGRDLREVFLVAPTNRDAKALVSNVVDGLLYEADQHRIAGRREDSIRVLDLATELAPDESRVKQKRAWAILGDAGAPDALTELEVAVTRAPDSFAARQQLDYALARQGRFDRVIELWTEYLAAHPDDGRAYLERGGAYFNLRRLPEAKSDATKACELGISEACVRAKQLP
jgi:tetratricopeptide (TPR) repeat protein